MTIVDLAPLLPPDDRGSVKQDDLANDGVSRQAQPGEACRPERGHWLADVPRRRQRRLRNPGLDGVQHSLEQLFLVSEVVIEGSLAHVGLLEHELDRCVLESVLSKQLRGYVEEPSTSRAASFLILVRTVGSCVHHRDRDILDRRSVYLVCEPRSRGPEPTSKCSVRGGSM